MESLKIMEDSAKYMRNLTKQIARGNVDINFDELDTRSKAEISEALNDVINRRIRVIENMITGVH